MNLPNGKHVPSPQQIADNAWVTIVTRAAMVVATLMLPLAGYTGKLILDDINNTAKDTLDQVKELTAELNSAHDSTLELSGAIAAIHQTDAEQDHRITRNEQNIDALRGYPRTPQ